MTFWSRLWAGWKQVAHRIGNLQSRLLLMVFYFVVVAPVAVTVVAMMMVVVVL